MNELKDVKKAIYRGGDITKNFNDRKEIDEWEKNNPGKRW